MKEIWRFIDSGANDGAFNMALDERMALLAEREDFTPTLRVYRWQPFTISIGFHQNGDDIDREKCRNAGLGLVRRPTGGRAILHAEEITYSVVLPANSIFYSEQIITSYKNISNALVAGLKIISPEIEFEQTEKALKSNYTRGYDNLPCFSTSIQYEIGANGKKLVGSAQRRYQNALLQHGAILIGPYHLKLVDYLIKKPGHSMLLIYLSQRTTCLNELTGSTTSYEQAAEAIRAGFAEALGIELVEGEFTQQELAARKDLAKYQIN